VCTRLHGVPATHLANGCPCNLRKTRHPSQRSPGRTRLSSVPSNQRSPSPGKENNRLLCSVRCASNSPVHPRTEGNQSLTNGDPITPRSLRTETGPPRHHGATYKHTLTNLQLLVSTFRDRGGSLGRREKCRRVPQPRWVGARPSAKEGERWPETGVREVEIPRPSCSSRAQVGCACSRGLQASTRERERAASRERLSRPRPRAANPL
jgi:hypothetical protein